MVNSGWQTFNRPPEERKFTVVVKEVTVDFPREACLSSNYSYMKQKCKSSASIRLFFQFFTPRVTLWVVSPYKSEVLEFLVRCA